MADLTSYPKLNQNIATILNDSTLHQVFTLKQKANKH